MKTMITLKRTEGDEKAMQISCWEFKTHAQKCMSNTRLLSSSLRQETLVSMNTQRKKQGIFYPHQYQTTKLSDFHRYYELKP